MFAIRQATIADLDPILNLAASIPEAPRWSRDAYETYLTHPEHRLLLAEEQQNLVGYIAGRVTVDICELESIGVSENTRGIGVGKVLLAALIEWARAHSASQMQLEVRAGNAAAIRFYCDAGFRSDGFRPDYYQRPDEDAVLMSLSLEPSPKP